MGGDGAGGLGGGVGARGYVLEVFSGHFELPNLGPIGGCGWVGMGMGDSIAG